MSHFDLARQMAKEEYRVLNAIELSMRRFEWVPLKNVAFYARYDPEEVQHWVDIVHKRDLLVRKVGKVNGYTLNSKAYDLLALHAMAERGVVASIGNSLGRGKESDVYQALGPDGARLALKFHRLGQVSFRNVRRKRDYLDGKHHVSWLYTCRLSATREAERLQALQPLDVDVPVLIAHNRHLIVMKQYDGQELHEFPGFENPGSMLERLVWNVRRIYHEAGLVHADLGEFNIVHTIDGLDIIIDWPQSVSRDHPDAMVLLRRDVDNLCTFFQKHGVAASTDVLLASITSP